LRSAEDAVWFILLAIDAQLTMRTVLKPMPNHLTGRMQDWEEENVIVGASISTLTKPRDVFP